MLPDGLKGVEHVEPWVSDPMSIVIDSEKVLRERKTFSKTFKHELQIFE